MKFDWKNSLLLALIFIVGFGVGAAVNLPVLDNSRLSAPEVEGASIMIDYGDGAVSTYSVSLTENENLLQAMEAVSKENNVAFQTKDYGDLGVLVTKIGARENGADNRYWQYWVNNVKPEVGAGAYVLKPGDIVEWKFAPFKEE